MFPLLFPVRDCIDLLDLEIYFGGSFKITNSISLIVTGLFNRAIQIIYFILGKLLQFVFFKELVHFIQLSNLCGQNCLQHSINIFLMSLGSVVVFYFILFLFVICVFSFFLCQSCQRFVNFIDLTKKLALCFVDFCVWCQGVF